MQFHVFLSHAGEDKDYFVRHLHSALAQEGILCFFNADAKYSLAPGTQVRRCKCKTCCAGRTYGVHLLCDTLATCQSQEGKGEHCKRRRTSK